MEATDKKVSYVAKGLVYGSMWGGGDGSYASKQIKSDVSLEDALKQIKAGVDDGSLDSGMGFQRLKGAYMEIIERTSVRIEGRLFTNAESNFHYVGNLKASEKDFLEEQMFRL